MAVETVTGEPAVQVERLHPDWIRARFANPPAWEPEIRVEMALPPGSNSRTPAAVLIPIVAHEKGPTILLTKRADHLYHHGGQVSFPGGRVDEGDESRLVTALREMEEEVGIGESHVEIIGTLPEYHTATGFNVLPVVAILRPPLKLNPDPFEVAETFEVPLSFLMSGANHQLRTAVFPNGMGRRRYYSMEYDPYFIWGATAGMLRNLFHFLRA
jgi:8-oxo-dGTP pyrophosphatase MutT (NUDIX family)